MIKKRLKDFFWMLLGNRDKCPECKGLSVVYANFPPFVSCGECGWKLRENYINKELRNHD